MVVDITELGGEVCEDVVAGVTMPQTFFTPVVGVLEILVVDTGGKAVLEI